jgi:hypothetical protein
MIVGEVLQAVSRCGTCHKPMPTAEEAMMAGERGHEHLRMTRCWCQWLMRSVQDLGNVRRRGDELGVVEPEVGAVASQ